jgi:hypothetical protein
MLAGMGDEPRRAKALTFEIEGQPVRCIETDDGKRTWLCECVDFQERTTRRPEGFCAHTALAIWRCIDDGSIDIRSGPPSRRLRPEGSDGIPSLLAAIPRQQKRKLRAPRSS